MALGKKYTGSQIANLWVQAGGSPKSAAVAAAIALQESGGYARATNHNSNGSVDRGIFQINSSNRGSTYNVPANIRAAVRLSKGGRNFRPWMTGGRYTGSPIGPQQIKRIRRLNTRGIQVGQARARMGGYKTGPAVRQSVMDPARAAALEGYLSNRYNPDALLSLAQTLRG